MQCKIIATAFNPKRVVKGPQAWPHHGQVLNTPELYRGLVRKTIELEVNEDPGIEMDTFIMVYEDPDGVWKEWEQYQGISTKRGKLTIVFEKEDGGGYLLFHKAYKMLREKYRWFLFTCDDVMVFGQDYFKQILEKWTWDTGYIGLQGAGESHVQGSIGLTHVYVLDQVALNNNGELPHPKGPFVQERNIHEGEIPFTHRITFLGLKLYPFNDSEKWDKNNLCYPYHNLILNI